MRAKVMVSMLILLFCSEVPARTRAVRHPSAPVAPKSLMWVAAHPDDEALVAPLLAKWCQAHEARCGFLLLTRGESGACLRPEGCSPDIASVRSAEAASSSQLFAADLILLRLPDGGGTSPSTWHTDSGDRPDVVSVVAGHIEAFRPEVILTFDPRHGTTCHPDHRETGHIVIEAVRRLPFAPKLYLLETRVSVDTNPFAIHFASAAEGVERFDATEVLYTGTSAWSAIVKTMQRHPSQFDDQWMAAIERVPPADRVISIAPADEIMMRPVSSCP